MPAIAAALLLSASCSTESTQSALLACESEYYSKVGTKSPDSADLDYLQNKGEHCRVCMLKKGREMNKSWNVVELSGIQLEKILAPKGLWTKMPADMTNAEANFVDQAQRHATARANAIAMCTTIVWKQ